MIFNSTTFLVFFLLFFFLYWLINNRMSIKTRNLFTIISSYIFYGWWDWRFLSLIVISSLSDYLIGLLLLKSKGKAFRKALLITSLSINLGILGFFKYFNFFLESLNQMLVEFNVEMNLSTLRIILPVGISFYTFQTLSYTIDAYRGKLEPTKDFLAFFAFVSFFPQLVAGPIERASNLLKQFQVKKTFNYHRNICGLRLILWGFFKKIVIADNLGYLADSLFNSGAELSGPGVFIGSACFALQIYADFSGYSDIAIGISKMLGYDLMTNFRTPYFADSFRTFWQRWHISLSSWFRDYVYIPLGGSRGKLGRTYLNILITFLLSGLWHGASITFIIWGGMHGILLIIEKQFKLKRLGVFYYPFVLLSVILLWIPFRAQSVSLMNSYYSSLLHFSSYSLEQVLLLINDYSITRFISVIFALVAFLFIEGLMNKIDFSEWIGSKRKYVRISVYYLLVFAIIFIGNFSVKPNFIYFQF